MKWSWRMGKFAGVDVYIHATFALLLGWVGVSHWLMGRSVDAAAGGIAFILALFACVLLHEFGHALAARRYGITTRDITLLPIGGLARLERMPEKPWQELWVALAGPAVNVVIAAGLYVCLRLTTYWTPVAELSVASGPFLERLLMANVSLVIFNLIPAFPMDGGRVLRALLAMHMDFAKATRTAASLGQGLAFVLGFVGLLTNPFLTFVALFVWISAGQEANSVQMKSALSGTPIHAAMLTDFRVLSKSDQLSHAAKLLLSGSQQDFPVMERNQVVGIVTTTDLLTALAEHGEDHSVATMMRTDFATAESSETLETIFERLHEHDCRTVPVFHNGQLVGLVTMENLAEYLLIQAALSRNGSSRSAPPALVPARG